MVKVICIKKTSNVTGRVLKRGEFFYVIKGHLNNYIDDIYRHGLYIKTIPIWDLIDNNYSIIGNYNSAYFLTLDEWREHQINKILNT